MAQKTRHAEESMITSISNSQVKLVIQLNQKARERKATGLFVAEGKKMFLEAPDTWVRQVFVSEAMTEDEMVMDRIRREKLPLQIVSDPVFRKISDTQTPQGVLAILKIPEWTLEDVLGKRKTARQTDVKSDQKAAAKADTITDVKSGQFSGKMPLLVVLEDIQDPGNAGTILRTGEGAGIAGVILTKTCVDVTNPKVIRSTMGSIYRIPWIYMENVPEIKKVLEQEEIRLFAADLSGKNTYDRENYSRGTAFLIGNEGKGLTKEASACADVRIRIPMAGRVESLNAAMAAGILMYEAARQRRYIL